MTYKQSSARAWIIVILLLFTSFIENVVVAEESRQIF